MTNTPTSDPIMKKHDFKVEYLPEDYSQYDLSFKLIVIGDSGVGKSCLSSKAVKDKFEEYYQATVGFEFLTFNLRLDDKTIKLQLWDTCGQEVYRSLITNFYRNSSLAVLVYSIDNEESFNNISSWLTDLKNQANSDIKIILVGNKCDLEDNRKISKEQAEKFKIDNDIDLFFETSAKTGYNTKSLLVEAAKMLYKDYINFKEGNRKDEKVTSKLADTTNKNNNKKKCCIEAS